MAHELDTREDGQKAAFIIGQKAWWQQEGEQLTEAPSIEVAKELAGHNFKVEVQPIFMRRVLDAPSQDPSQALQQYIAGYWKQHQAFPNAKQIVAFMDGLDRGDEVFIPIEGHGATVRTDRFQQPLGIVGSRYAPFQNEDAWGIIEPLLDAGLATLETGGTLREGRDIWILVRLNLNHPVVQEVYEQEGLRPYVLLVNNHAGTRVVIGKEVVERVVCANTLEIALGEHSLRAFRVRHSGDVDVKVTDAAIELFGSLTARHVKAAEQYQALRGRQLDEKMFRSLVLDAAAPLDEKLVKADPAKLTGRQKGSLERQMARRARLEALWTAGIGHTGDHSAFEAYQAVTQSLDHDQNLWVVRGDGTRAEAQIFGRLASIKRTVLGNLLKAGK